MITNPQRSNSQHKEVNIMSLYHIYSIGNALVDTEVSVSDSDIKELGLTKGGMLLIDETERNALADYFKTYKQHQEGGGSAANTIIAATLLGSTCFYSCKIAQDEQGQFFHDSLNSQGISLNRIERTSTTDVTGTCWVLVSPDAERSMATYLGISSSFSPNDLSETHLQESQYLYIEGYLLASPSGFEAVLVAQQIAKKSGVKTVLSLSDPSIVANFASEIQEVTSCKLDILFCNEVEAFTLTDCPKRI